jgi:hypothetical protein
MFAFAAIFYAQPGDPGNVVYFNNVGTSDAANIWRVGPTSTNGTTFWTSNSAALNYWTPPAIGQWGGLVGPLLAVGIFLTTPRAINIVREAIHPKYRPSAAEGAATEAIQKGAGRIPMIGSLTKA